MEERVIGPGHNKPPITPPTEDEFLADLQAKHPELEPKFKELSDKFIQTPGIIKDDEVAGKIQDLYRTMRDFMDEWDDKRKKAKKPWDRLAKVVQNFFATKIDELETMSLQLRARHTAYVEDKAEVTRKAAAAEAERQRKEAERLRKEAEDAERRQLEAEQAARAAEERQARAIAEEAAAKRRRAEQEEMARLAREEEARLEAERKDRERQEKLMIAENLQTLQVTIGEAEVLFGAMVAAGDDAPIPERLDAILVTGGPLTAPFAATVGHRFLTDNQRAEVAQILQSARDMRAAVADRLNAKEKKRRKAEEEEHNRIMDRMAEESAAIREKEEKSLAAARKEREEAEAGAERAKQEAKDARKDMRAAQVEQGTAEKQGQQAGREARDVGKEADKVGRRADRLDNKVANSSDADMSQTRGTYSVGSLSGRWEPRVVDRDALVASLGALGPYIHPKAVDEGLTKFMRQHQGEWADKRRDGCVADKLAGVVFDFVPDSRIA